MVVCMGVCLCVWVLIFICHTCIGCTSEYCQFAHCVLVDPNYPYGSGGPADGTEVPAAPPAVNPDSMEEFPSLTPTPTSTPSGGKGAGKKEKGKGRKAGAGEEKSYVDICSTAPLPPPQPAVPVPVPAVRSTAPQSSQEYAPTGGGGGGSEGGRAHVPSVQMQLSEWVVSGKQSSVSYLKHREEAKTCAQARAVYFDNATQAYLR